MNENAVAEHEDKSMWASRVEVVCSKVMRDVDDDESITT